MDGNTQMEVGRFADLLDQAYEEGMDLLAYLYDEDLTADEVVSGIVSNLDGDRRGIRELLNGNI